MIKIIGHSEDRSTSSPMSIRGFPLDGYLIDTRRALARRVSYIWVLYVQNFCVNIWCQYLMSIFGQYLMSIFDVTIWSLKRNPCKSNIFSIYKRIPCKFNIGFLLLKTWDFFMIEQKHRNFLLKIRDFRKKNQKSKKKIWEKKNPHF